MTQRFSIDPDPPSPGKPLTICYDFTGLSITSVDIKIDWRPDTIPSETRTVTSANNCVTVTVPAGASGGFLIDPTQNSDDLGFLCD